MYALSQPIQLDFNPAKLTDEQFYSLCHNNPDLNIERNAQDVVILLPPASCNSGIWEMELGGELGIWNRQSGLGKVFSSSTLFQLPGSGDRLPDAAWVELSRWQALTADQRQKFPPIAPDFVIELRSRTDNLDTLREKMLEYMDSGVRLGWMFNPQDQEVEIYRQGQSKEVVSLPAKLSGEEVLPGFVLSCELFLDD